MGSNRLKMNPEKTQFIWLGLRNQLAAIHIASLYLHDETIISPSTNLCNLGAIFDSEMTMSDHVNNFTRTCFFTNFANSFSCDILCRPTLLECMLVHAFVSSRVDYYNSLLYGTGIHVTHKLQAVLNAAARLITGVGRYDHITPILRDALH